MKCPLKIIGNLKWIIFFLSFILFSCDPGWKYFLKDSKPSVPEENIYSVDIDSLHLVLHSWDFVFQTNVEIDMAPVNEEATVRPNFAYIRSLKNTDYTRLPKIVSMSLDRRDRPSIRRTFELVLSGEDTLDLNKGIDYWDQGLVHIWQWRILEYEDTTNPRQEFNRTFVLRKQDTLHIQFIFRSFAHDSFINRSGGSDFVFVYPAIDSARPVQLTFLIKQ